MKMVQFGVFRQPEIKVFIMNPGQCQNLPTQCTATEIPPTPTKTSNGEPTGGVTKKLLPLAACFMAFAIVMTILIIYMENIAMKHYQFRMNMSQDYELLNVAQDNLQLVTYIREVQLRPAVEPHHKPLESYDNISDTAAYVLKLLNNKANGVFVESGAYSDGKTSETEWLERKLKWRGLLIQPDPRHYFILLRHNRVRSQAVHACLSPMPYPREITLHQDSDGVKINSLDDPDWFNTRVKCFPLFSLLLAMNVTNVNYLSLDTGGSELQVLETVPYERVKIEVISVHLHNLLEEDTIKGFLSMKNYTFMQNINITYIFKLNTVKN